MTPEQSERPTRGRKRAAVNKRRDWKPEFLKAFEETGVISTACKAAGVGRTTVHDARQSDETFALAMHDADQAFSDSLEREGYKRAVDGSDRLLEFFLKARKPETYRENSVKVEHSGSISPGLEALSDEQLADLEAGL